MITILTSMTDTLIVIGISLVAIALMFLCVGLKYLLKKDDEVQGSCSARNELLDEKGCSICGKTDSSGCDGPPENINDNITKKDFQ